jgi:hypothetical protein
MSTANILIGLNIAGFVSTAIGGILGMFGVFKQANGYYPFKIGELLKHMAYVMAVLPFSTKSANAEVHTAAHLAANNPEDRAASLIGIYFVFFGFLGQLLGGALLLIAALLAR